VRNEQKENDKTRHVTAGVVKPHEPAARPW
jgi:hypothetical protein